MLLKFSAPAGPSKLRIRVRNDFGVAYDASLPPLGARSQGLRILSEAWTPGHDALTMDVSGVSGGVYELTVWNPSQAATVDGGELIGTDNGLAKVRVRFPLGGPGEYAGGKIIFHFPAKQGVQAKQTKPPT